MKSMIYAILKKEHQRMTKMLERAMHLSLRAKKTRLKMLDTLRALIIPHARAEEAVLYAFLLRKKETRAVSLEAIEEHRIAERLLKELVKTGVADEHWRAKMEVLRETMEHHFREEEGEMFKCAREVLTRAQAEEIGEVFLREEVALRKKLL